MPLPLATAAADTAPGAEELLAAFRQHLAVTGRGNVAYARGARAFLRTWPEPQRWADEPLAVRIKLGQPQWPFVMFLLVHRLLRPGWDWLVRRKLSSIWREITASGDRGGHDPLHRRGNRDRVHPDRDAADRFAVGRQAVDPDRSTA